MSHHDTIFSAGDFLEPSNNLLRQQVQHIRDNPTLFLPDGQFNPIRTVGLLIADAQATGVTVHSYRQDDWWILAGEEDWLPSPAEEVFVKILPCVHPDEQFQANGMRSEILLQAFATDVVTGVNTAEEGYMVLRGHIDDDLLRAVDSSPGDVQRFIAFRV